ncbi:kinase-like domain, phloem protein 2-like protein [Tanacetum coccineum]
MKSDIYSFGVVLLEILTGRLAYDSVYTKVNEKGIAPIARHHFEKGTIMQIVDHKIKEETDEHVFSLSKGPNKESLAIFLELVFRCVADSQAQRPTIEVVINELKKALDSQENHKDNLKLSLEDIKLATKGFSQDNIIGHGDSGNVYKGATHSTHGDNIIAAKRLGKKSAEGEAEFMTELEILMEYRHENVIGLVGYCDEEDEKIIVYDYASRGSLDKYLSDDSLTWVMRLKICIDIAIGLEFLHGTVSSPELVIHRDINSSNILLFDDWKAKMTRFFVCGFVECPTNLNVDLCHRTMYTPKAQIGYRDPLQSTTLENSFEDYEKWEPKLPKDYKEIFQMSKCPDDYSTIKKEDLYNIFSKGILLKQDKVLLSFHGNGERNKMVSATTFSYINGCPVKWQSLPESRFGTVVEMSDISNLNINIKTNAQFLSPDVVYGVYLVFKFCDSKNFSSIPAYVNLKYRKGAESQHAYFATWRNKEWMMIELDRYSNQKEDDVFEFLLESFSTYQYGDGAIYVEGIEFRAIEKVKLEEIGKLEEAAQVLKSNFGVYQLQQLPTKLKDIFKKYTNSEDMFWLGKVNGKKLLMLSAKATIFKFSDVNLYSSRTSIHCRVPNQREDGWMEIQLWKFNSAHEFKDDSLSINMKFTSLEGTMSGLIVCGLEFRPVLEVKVDRLHSHISDSSRTESDNLRKSEELQRKGRISLLYG